ncbi:MAG: NYN domain-containing protein [Pseudomonadota bacterium]
MPVNSKLIAKIEAEHATQRLAVLIDADNAQPSVIEALLAEIALLGEATVKRIYGDFTASTSAQWKKCLHQFAIKPVQQFAYTKGKNATDSTLIIDAMDLLYTRRFDGFCLVSSDSDFTGLALRIREEGLMVYGFGEEKTPEAFRNACHKFVFTEVLRPSPTHTVGNAIPPAKKTSPKCSSVAMQESAKQGGKTSKEIPREFFRQAFEQACDDSGWAHLGAFGSYLTKLRSDFDSRNYGYRKLSDLVKALNDLFEFEERKLPSSGQKDLYVRIRTT